MLLCQYTSHPLPASMGMGAKLVANAFAPPRVFQRAHLRSLRTMGGKTANIAKIVTSQMMAVLAVLA
jgi:hypothetical protein